MQQKLLHTLLPLLKPHISNEVFCHFGLFVTAIQLLNKDSVNLDDIVCADQMLCEYHKLNVQLYGEESQTFTNHALLHLSVQRFEHGCPLVLLSNFVFEGFIASIKRQYHGSRGIIPQMVRNIGLLQNIGEICRKINNERIRRLSEEICHKKKPQETEIGDGVILIGKLSNVRPVIHNLDIPDIDYPADETLFCERVFFEGITYHSLAYRYRRSSNSYTVSFFVNELKFGEVVYYLMFGDVCYMLIKILEKTDDMLYSPDMASGLSDVIDAFIVSGKLGQFFIPVKESDEFEIVPVACIRNKMIYVPSEEGGYLSIVLKSYQHD